MALIVNNDLTVDDLIRILQSLSDDRKGEALIDIVLSDEGRFFDIEKIKFSNMVEIHLKEQ